MVKTNIQIRWHDFDIFGHIYNGQYQQFFDLGKSDYFAQIMGVKSDLSATDEAVITASVHLNFFSSIEMNEPVEIRTKAEKIGTKSITIFQQAVNPDTNAIKADCTSVMVGYNPQTKTTFEIPQKWRKSIAQQGNQNNFTTFTADYK